MQGLALNAPALGRRITLSDRFILIVLSVLRMIWPLAQVIPSTPWHRLSDDHGIPGRAEADEHYFNEPTRVITAHSLAQVLLHALLMRFSCVAHALFMQCSCIAHALLMHCSCIVKDIVSLCCHMRLLQKAKLCWDVDLHRRAFARARAMDFLRKHCPNPMMSEL
jgi:hypothetical protein